VKVESRSIEDLAVLLRDLRVSAVIFDFDGVFTDNRVLTFQDGTEAVFCSRSDGMGVEMLRHAGLPMVVLSKERNPVTTARCIKLGLDVVQGIDDKVPAMTAWLAERNLDPERTIYVGNDVNDLPCMRLVGCAVAVADAHPAVLAEADVVLPEPGGNGAVRFLADAILDRLGSTH
jgi:N-acylneuraminate cytidylyltransferase